MLIKKIVKRGTSNFILLPSDIMDMLNLTLGDEVSINVENGKIILTPIEKNVNLPVEKDVD
ncbi:MAG: hypothetical protein EHM20_00195 [Alphaproteobacteria bacterium]|nr:MAG: hypothetical protein EHM20_00195 [Alphaproteobacteria bacterium]